MRKPIKENLTTTAPRTSIIWLSFQFAASRMEHSMAGALKISEFVCRLWPFLPSMRPMWAVRLSANTCCIFASIEAHFVECHISGTHENRFGGKNFACNFRISIYAWQVVWLHQITDLLHGRSTAQANTLFDLSANGRRGSLVHAMSVGIISAFMFYMQTAFLLWFWFWSSFCFFIPDVSSTMSWRWRKSIYCIRSVRKLVLSVLIVSDLVESDAVSAKHSLVLHLASGIELTISWISFKWNISGCR